MIKKSYLSCLLGSILLISQHAISQTDEAQIRNTITSLFDGMRKGDSAMVRSAFSPNAVMQTIVKNKEGKVIVHTETVEAFASFVGKPHKEVYDEKISFSSIKIDAELATAWTPYQFFLDDKFLHCGVNSFQLVKIEGQWKIQYIIDTRRKTGCE